MGAGGRNKESMVIWMTYPSKASGVPGLGDTNMQVLAKVAFYTKLYGWKNQSQRHRHDVLSSQWTYHLLVGSSCDESFLDSPEPPDMNSCIVGQFWVKACSEYISLLHGDNVSSFLVSLDLLSQNIS